MQSNDNFLKYARVFLKIFIMNLFSCISIIINQQSTIDYKKTLVQHCLYKTFVLSEVLSINTPATIKLLI